MGSVTSTQPGITQVPINGKRPQGAENPMAMKQLTEKKPSTPRMFAMAGVPGRLEMLQRGVMPQPPLIIVPTRQPQSFRIPPGLQVFDTYGLSADVMQSARSTHLKERIKELQEEGRAIHRNPSISDSEKAKRTGEIRKKILSIQEQWQDLNRNAEIGSITRVSNYTSPEL